LPKETEFIVITNSGEMRAIAKNPTRGEVYYGPDLKISRFSGSQQAIDSMDATQINELWGEGDHAYPSFRIWLQMRRPAKPARHLREPLEQTTDPDIRACLCTILD
jgi:hypothetical protein